MDFDYEKYEKECEQIRKANERYLDWFEEDMAGLSPATRKRHLGQ